MKRTTKEVSEAINFLNAIKILLDLKDMQYVYGDSINLLWCCLQEIEIDDQINYEK
jgi:hypothetical protein